VDDIERLVRAFDQVRQTISQADAGCKGDLYRQLRLTLTYHPRKQQNPGRG
jgi:hypothetical protein